VAICRQRFNGSVICTLVPLAEARQTFPAPTHGFTTAQKRAAGSRIAAPKSSNIATVFGLKAKVAKGLSDGEILGWIQATAPLQRSEWEIAQWSAHREQAASSGQRKG
jgi:hypothetical protein